MIGTELVCEELMDINALDCDKSGISNNARRRCYLVQWKNM